MPKKPNRITELSEAGFTDDQIAIWIVVESWRLRRLGFSEDEVYRITHRPDESVSPEVLRILALMKDKPAPEAK